MAYNPELMRRMALETYDPAANIRVRPTPVSMAAPTTLAQALQVVAPSAPAPVAPPQPTELGPMGIPGYDSEGNYVGGEVQALPVGVSPWAAQRGLGDLERRVATGTTTPADIAFMGQISSVPPSAGAQAMWNDYVARVQDQEAGSDLSKFAENFQGPLSVALPVATAGLASALTPAAPTAESLAAADAAGGLTPEFGTTAAYNAGIGLPATTVAPTIAPIQLADSGLTMTDVGPGLASTPPAAGTGLTIPQISSLDNSLALASGNGSGITTNALTTSGDMGLGSGITSSLAGNVTPVSTALSDAALTNAGLASLSLPALATAPAVAGVTPSVAGGTVTAPVATAATAGAANGTGSADTSQVVDPYYDPNTGQTAGNPADVGIKTNPLGGYDVNGVPLPLPTNTVTTGIGNTKLSDILSGKVGLGDIASALTLGDLTKAFGTAGLTIGSIAGDKAQADALQNLSDKYIAIGEPSRARYEASFDPNFDINNLPGLKSALDVSTQSILRGLSAKDGNPWGNPAGLAEALKYASGNIALPALQQYRNQQAATSGYGAFSTAAPTAAAGAINQTGNIYADVGRGVGNIFSPPTSLEQALKSLKGL